MKNVNKVLVSVAVMAVLLSTTAFATSFGDVKEGQWFYNPVMKATQQGLFAGYDDGEFKPQASMTRGAFITVVGRILELDTTAKSSVWYEQAYISAVDAGLIKKGEMDLASMEGDISRQEMALVAVRAMELRGETIGSVNTQNVLNAIPDKAQIGSYYKDFVVKAYSEGILEGDTDGSFRPQGTLTRAEASTVIVKLIDSSERKKKDFSQVTATINSSNPNIIPITESTSPITIYENQPRTAENNRLAKAGDIYVKSTGEQVVLAIGEHGVLGEGQGVAPDLGLIDYVGVGENMQMWPLTNNERLTTGKYGENSIGIKTSGDEYAVNPLTHEGHWMSEWSAISKHTHPTVDGTEVGQISEDQNYVWDGIGWTSLAKHPEYLK